MTEKKSLVEETLLQMKDLENVISENAKGILASTMKQEIGELVKESLKEQDDEKEVGLAMADDEDDDELDLPSDDEDNDELDLPSDDDEPIDLTDASDDEILKVFKGMGEEDGIIIKKDGPNIDLQDTNEDVEYKIHMGESEEEFDLFSNDFEDEEVSTEKDDYSDMSSYDEISSMSDDMFSEEYDEELDEESDEELDEESDEEVVYEIEMDEESDEELDEESDEELDEESDEELDEESDEEVVYEIEMDEESDEELDEMSDDETYTVEEGFKAKGKGFGKPKFKYAAKPNQQGGFKEKMKQGPKSVGTGKAKFNYKDGENAGSKLGKNKIVKKTETKEASRTLGSGKYFGKKGLPKPKAAPRHLKVESKEVELNLLREKNEEYRKALNLFRGKLNEVAVFNSNLAYATRLFTEHSTTKQEKINILRRFDSVETLKESKSLYKIIKDELSSQTTNKPTKEAIQEQIERTPASGSAVSLIESKTYENPQFMRMKDLMVKMNVKK